MKKEKINLHSQMSMVLNDKKVVSALLSGDRENLEIESFNSMKSVPL